MVLPSTQDTDLCHLPNMHSFIFACTAKGSHNVVISCSQARQAFTVLRLKCVLHSALNQAHEVNGKTVINLRGLWIMS